VRARKPRDTQRPNPPRHSRARRVVDRAPIRAYTLAETPAQGRNRRRFPQAEVMPVFKRIALFLLTNLAILLVFGVILNVLEAAGVFRGSRFLQSYGPLMVMAAVFGFGGSFLSLAMSKWIAKWTTGAKIITAPRNQSEAWLLQTVQMHAQRASIGMPEVAIYDGPEPNAFATGATRNKALVAVSSGLLANMNRDEIEAVLGHEITHVANGDMVTLTLLQGVLNTFVIFFSRVIGGLVDSFLRRGDDDRRGIGIGYWVTTMLAELVLGILAMIIVMAFSRYREFRADAGGAQLAGRHKMIAALRRLQHSEEGALPKSLAAFGISGGGSRLLRLFRSHPPLEERIRRLEQSPALG
jgi:heat shock protein HtpX